MKNDSNSQTVKEALSALVDDEFSSSDAASTEDEVIELACEDREVRSAWQSMHLVRDVMQADYHPALSTDFSARVSAVISQEQSFAEDHYTDAVQSAAAVGSMSEARGRRALRTHQQIRGAQPAQRSGAGRVAGRAPVQSMQQPFALWKPVAGLGLAASLAGATFLFSQLLQSEQTDPGENLGQVAQSESQPVANPVAIASTQNVQERALEDLTLQASVRTGNSGTRWRMDSEVPRNEEIETRLNMLLTNHLEDASMGRVHGLVSHSRVVGYDSVSGEQ